MVQLEVRTIAALMYDEVITRAGWEHPATWQELAAIMTAGDDGAELLFCEDAPSDFTALQMGRTIYINDGLHGDGQRLLHVLAHEWGHYLRRSRHGTALRVWLYHNDDTPAQQGRKFEEAIAKAFERLF